MHLLREATAPYHARIETALDMMQHSVSIMSYRALLERMYGFYAPWETLMAALVIKPELSFYQDRWKLTLLQEDLRHLGHTHETLLSLPTETLLPPLDTVAKALGSMYVIEGSTLGGKFIAKHMKDHLGVTSETGCAFFSAYGKEAARYWKEFGEQAQHWISEAEIESALASACATFSAMQHWLCKKEPVAA